MALRKQNFSDPVQKKTVPKFGLNKKRNKKMCFFQPISRRISETVRNRANVDIDHQ